MQPDLVAQARTEQSPARPGCHPVLAAVADALADLGFEEVCQAKQGSDLEDAVVRALRPVRLFSPPAPTGSLRGDLLAMLQRWLGCPTREERAIGALLTAASWHPRIREAVASALDRPLATAISAILARTRCDDRLPLRQVPTLTWILRSVAVDRLRCGTPRTQVDLEQLVDHLLLRCPDHPSARPDPSPPARGS